MNNAQKHTIAGFLLDYSSTLKTGVISSLKRQALYMLHGVTTQKTVNFTLLFVRREVPI
jgi:hypothetical protein